MSDFFRNLEDALQGHEDKVEILISDNASTDQTEQVCKAEVERLRDRFDIKYCRNAENIGVAANLVSLLYETRGQFFTFIGDDDRLDRAALAAVMAAVK